MVLLAIVIVWVSVVVVDCLVQGALMVLLLDPLYFFPALSTNPTSFASMYLFSLFII